MRLRHPLQGSGTGSPTCHFKPSRNTDGSFPVPFPLMPRVVWRQFLTPTPSSRQLSAYPTRCPQKRRRWGDTGRLPGPQIWHPPSSPLPAPTQGPRLNTPSTWRLSSCRSLSDMWENLQLEPKSHWPAKEDREDRVTHCLEELPPRAEGHPGEGPSEF